jgi:hypothetical protein
LYYKSCIARSFFIFYLYFFFFFFFYVDVYVSACMDEGKYYLFDARTKITEAVYYMDCKKEDLYTHERYNDFNVLLGFGDGEVRHIDMRSTKEV